MANAGALKDVTVLDLTRLAPGPFCTMILGDLGAEVIRVEEPGPPTGRRARQAATAAAPPSAERAAAPQNALARNKRSIGLDLKSAPGKEIFTALAERADVLVEEFRPGVARRLGIDYETLAARNPRLVYCSITGYGQNGPYRDLVGHDINYIALAGALSVIGRKDQPPTIPHNLLADYAGGGMQAVVGILAALLARSQNGRGQYIDVAMADGVMQLLAERFSAYFRTGKLGRRGEGMFDGGLPHYNVYRTGDGRYIALSALEPWFFANLFRALGREDLIEHEFNRDKYPEIERFLTETFASKTRDEWFEFLRKAEVGVAPVLDLDEVERDPQVMARGMIVELETADGGRTRQVGIPIKFSSTPGSIRRMPPSIGQHTDEILGELGYGAEAIANWRRQGAIR